MAFVARSTLLRAVKCVSTRRFLATSQQTSKEMNYPIHANTLGRFAGISSMMRLPVQENADGLDACFVGIPFDSGTSYRPGTRYDKPSVDVEHNCAFIGRGQSADPDTPSPWINQTI